jgi:hypothetical protein
VFSLILLAPSWWLIGNMRRCGRMALRTDPIWFLIVASFYGVRPSKSR